VGEIVKTTFTIPESGRSGDLLQVVVGKGDQAEITETENWANIFRQILATADAGNDSVAIPFPFMPVSDADVWALAQGVAETVRSYDAETVATGGSLRHVSLYNMSLTTADILGFILRQLLYDRKCVRVQEKPESHDSIPDVQIESSHRLGDESENQQPSTGTEVNKQSEWFEIDRVLRQRKNKSRMQYLVKWKGNETNTWVDRKNLSDAALQHFLMHRKQRKRKQH
jgi:hypothetical protein